jgi:hypothetical protein
MKLWKMKKSCDFDHEIMNLVEKNVGTPAILGITLLMQNPSASKCQTMNCPRSQSKTVCFQ